MSGTFPFRSLDYIYDKIYSYGIDVTEARLPKGKEGFYYEDGEERIIVVSSSLTTYKKRSTATHELVHALLHESTGVPYCRNSLWQGRFEREANIYTARILIPEDRLLELLKMDYSISEIAEEFLVSEDLVRVAIEDTGL